MDHVDPTTYNADTLGIRPDLIDKPISSWSSLLDPDFAGRAAILNIPSIGIMDAAMALEARGDLVYGDKGNMTREEIDATIAALIEAKRAGQFRAFWSNFNESVNLMASGEVVIQSMWSPAVTAVRTQGIPCVYQPLEEGYRAWASGFGLPRTIEGRRQDAAYEFINWFLSGWAGAHLSRQGYYPAVLETRARAHGALRVGLLVRGPTRGRADHGARRPAPGGGRRGARRRLLRGAHGRGRLLERRHGREPVHGPQVERVHRRVSDVAAPGTRTAGGAAPARGTRRRAAGGSALWQAAPMAVVFAAFFLLPLAVVVTVSFWEFTQYSIEPAFIARNYLDVFDGCLGDLPRLCTTFATYLSTLKFCALVWMTTLGVGFAVAYFLAFHVRTLPMQILLFVLCTIPFWTSIVIRMVAWIPLLGRNGLVNGALIDAGLIDRPLEWLLYSDFSVVLALTHLYTLFMVVPIFNSMMRIDRALIEAARDAGASGFQTLTHVVIPLAKPGILIGSIFVVTIVMGDFLTIGIMGGQQIASVGKSIQTQIQFLQFPIAAANAVVLLLAVLLAISMLLRMVDIRKEL